MSRGVTGNIPSLHNCALGRWCEMEGRGRLGKKPDFQELLWVHAQLHRVAQEIIWYEGLSSGETGIRAMEHFNDLWRQLLGKINKVTHAGHG